MGHISLKRIPKTKKWSSVISQLDVADAKGLSTAIVDAARSNYAALEGNKGINYCFWILIRIITASRNKEFLRELELLGINISNVTSGLGFIQQISNTIAIENTKRTRSSVFVEMAELSLKEILTQNIVEESKSIFGTNIQDIQSALYKFSSPKRFGILAREFFAEFMYRTIIFISDKEISNYVGPGKPIKNSKEVLQFKSDLSRYCYEAAKIIEEFSSGWFSKHNWESKYDISEESTLSFTSYALTKIQMELQKGTE